MSSTYVNKVLLCSINLSATEQEGQPLQEDSTLVQSSSPLKDAGEEIRETVNSQEHQPASNSQGTVQLWLAS